MHRDRVCKTAERWKATFDGNRKDAGSGQENHKEREGEGGCLTDTQSQFHAEIRALVGIKNL